MTHIKSIFQHISLIRMWESALRHTFWRGEKPKVFFQLPGARLCSALISFLKEKDAEIPMGMFSKAFWSSTSRFCLLQFGLPNVPLFPQCCRKGLASPLLELLHVQKALKTQTRLNPRRTRRHPVCQYLTAEPTSAGLAQVFQRPRSQLRRLPTPRAGQSPPEEEKTTGFGM